MTDTETDIDLQTLQLYPDFIKKLRERYLYYLEKGNHEAATYTRRRLNRLVIRREAASGISPHIHTRTPTTQSHSDAETIGDGSTTLLKEYDIFDPVDRANEINSWWGEQ